MITLISDSNIAAINAKATALIHLIKTEKIFITNSYNPDARIKPSTMLLEVIRAFSNEKANRFSGINTESVATQDKLFGLVSELDALLGQKSANTCQKIKEYQDAKIKVKLCRELVSSLEDAFILGDIDRDDIHHVYDTLGKALPKKFVETTVPQGGERLYHALQQAIREKAELIKANSIAHYQTMVNRIDPDDTLDTPKAFFQAGRKNLSDMSTLRLCLACKFNRTLFSELIGQEFDLLVTSATCRLFSHYRSPNDNAEINLSRVNIGGKGFDVRMTLDGLPAFARAIPVEGPFVRFHYRYIIT